MTLRAVSSYAPRSGLKPRRFRSETLLREDTRYRVISRIANIQPHPCVVCLAMSRDPACLGGEFRPPAQRHELFK